MATLTRDAILAVQDIAREEIKIPEWGGSVYIKRLTAAERLALSERTVGADGADFMALVLIACVVDADGQQLLEDSDAALLAGKAGTVVQRLFNVADRLNGFTDRRARELEKN